MIAEMSFGNLRTSTRRLQYDSGQGPVEGHCEHDNEISYFIGGREILEHMN